MNCKFCGNFVPDGKDSCPVCGRRPEEEPIGKLLSENQPNSSKPETEENTMSETQKPKRHPKGLVSPVILLALGVGGWAYMIIEKVFAQVKALFNAVSAGFNSDTFETFRNSTDFPVSLIIFACMAVASILAVIGLIMLFRNLFNRMKYRDE